MEGLYKITKADADLLGRFEYAPNEAFDPYCSEQDDGTFIVSETIYNILRDHPRFKKVNWSLKEKIQFEQLNTKQKDDRQK